MGMERRWGARKPVEVDVVIDNQPLCLLRGRIGNISIGGLFVQTAGSALHENAKVELVLLLQEDGTTRVYRMPALVVRVTPDGAGFMFDQYDVNAFRTLVALVLDRQKRTASLAPVEAGNDAAGPAGEPARGTSARSVAVPTPPLRGESAN